MMQVPFLDLQAQYISIKDEMLIAIGRVLDSGQYVGGPFVAEFESSFARAQKANHCIAVSSGTSALHVALWALGVGPGDEVIVPANTFFATAEAVSLCGATPVFVDCDPADHTIDVQQLERAITSKTRAAIAVHLYGQPAQLERIKAVCDSDNIFLVEDCAQAHLAEHHGRRVGTWGHCGCFSFYPGKNLGAYGEGGAVVTNDAALAERMRMIREHGSKQKYHHDIVGHNYRMHGIQGAILSTKLKYLPKWTEQRRQNAAYYQQQLAGIEGIRLPQERADATHVYHLYIIETEVRDELAEFLQGVGIGTGVHYPISCHLQPAYSSLKYRPGSLPVAERAAREILSLPMYPELSREKIDYVAEKISEFSKGHGETRSCACKSSAAEAKLARSGARGDLSGIEPLDADRAGILTRRDSRPSKIISLKTCPRVSKMRVSDILSQLELN